MKHKTFGKALVCGSCRKVPPCSSGLAEPIRQPFAHGRFALFEQIHRPFVPADVSSAMRGLRLLRIKYGQPFECSDIAEPLVGADEPIKRGGLVEAKGDGQLNRVEGP
jgi:hypothetical protein